MHAEPRIKQFLRQQSRFMGYLMALTRDLAAAEEIFQEAAVVVLERDRDAEIDDFLAWAKEVVRRQALRYLREKGRMRTLDPALLEGISLAFLEDRTGDDRAFRERDALRRCVDKLPPKSAEMVVLRYGEGRTFEQIARTARSTAGAVQRALSRLRRALHECVRASLSSAEGA